jgi:hypothetical protein
MFKKLALALLFLGVFVANTFSHNPDASQAPLQKFHLKNHRHLHASFLMMKKDSVFLETEKGMVQVFPLADFSKKDQQYFLGKMVEIARINQPVGATNSVQVVENPIDYTSQMNAWLWLCLVPFAAAFLFLKKSKKWSLAAALSGAAILAAFKTESIQKMLGTDPLFMDAAFQPFKPHVATHWDDDWFYVESNGLPTTHSMMTGIVKWQQQVPIPQCYTGTNAWQIPLNPVLAAQPVPVNNQHFLRGAVAIAANGIPIFNPYTNTGVDAFLDGQLDQWGGHSGRADDYHYHIAPMFLDTQTLDVLPIAFALDGFAVYADHEPDGSPMLPLDANHGHFDGAGVYHYHGTPEAPYMIGNMVGQVTEDSTLQIVPQARAKPVRPSLTPLNGATITDFQPNGNGNGYILTYTRNGQTFQVDYSWTPTGVYTYKFISPTGTTTETYNGQAPCTSLVSTDDFFEKAADVTVFPNPTTGNLFLKINTEKDPRLLGVQVFDLNGRLVFQKKNPGTELELGNLARGGYWAKIQFEKGEISRKIIVK